MARKRPGCAEEAQEEIYQWVEEAVNQGNGLTAVIIIIMIVSTSSSGSSTETMLL